MWQTDDRQTDHATEKCVAAAAKAIPPKSVRYGQNSTHCSVTQFNIA